MNDYQPQYQPDYQPYPSQYAPLPPPPPESPNFRGKLVALIAVGAVVVAGIISTIVVATSGGGERTFLNDKQLLVHSIRSAIEQKAAKLGLRVTDVGCVDIDYRHYLCNIQETRNVSFDIHVTVSSDGNNWVSQ